MKKDRKNKKSSLQLSSEMIRLLSVSQLSEVAGGDDSVSNNTCGRYFLCKTY
jgi:hypothetical protein